MTQFYTKKVVLVIDEAHLITSDSTFRNKVIGDLLETVLKNEHNLLMSATPTTLYLPNSEINHFEVLAKDKKEYAAPSLVFCQDKKMTSFAFEKCKAIAENKERAIIHLNSIKQARLLQNLLLKEKIGVHFLASTSLTPTEKENFDSIQSKSTFNWNDEKQIIITTSVLEAGFNIETDRKTTNIYLNKTRAGFDTISYRQFIARIRNYDKKEVENIIVTPNYAHFLPDEKLVLEYDYQTRIQLATQNQAIHNQLYQKTREEYGDEFHDFETRRLKTDVSKNLYFDEEKGSFQINYQELFAAYTHDKNTQGSPYFEKPKQILFYEQSINEGVSQYQQFQKAEKDKAGQEVAHLFVNDFEKLVVSVEKYTQDVKLKTKLNFASVEDPVLLTPLQLLLAENLLKHYLHLLKTSNEKGITEIAALKSILVDTENLTLRKTNDLRRRKVAFISYWLMLRKQTKKRLGVSEALQVAEFKRVLKIFKQLKGKLLSAEEVTQAINHSSYQKKKYSKRKCLELLQLLCQVERIAIVEQGKKNYFYTYSGEKDYKKAISDLLGQPYFDK